ncbi:MAG: pyridoxamine 5'-phosphate oxidase family protein [Chloroflexota bacterium]|nr:pyridoxamine 5'-phosphate oxidase family protein [Chloroflexota bacterium]
MSELDEFALGIVNGRHVATLATQGQDGLIHLTAVWYMYKDGDLFVATGPNSRKVRNIESSPVASLMIDTRKPGFEYGLTGLGTATLIRGDEAQLLSLQIHERYLTEKALNDPEIGGFFSTNDDVVIRLSPSSWVSWDMGQINNRFFGGKLSTETGYLFPLDQD